MECARTLLQDVRVRALVVDSSKDVSEVRLETETGVDVAKHLISEGLAKSKIAPTKENSGIATKAS